MAVAEQPIVPPPLQIRLRQEPICERATAALRDDDEWQAPPDDVVAGRHHLDGREVAEPTLGSQVPPSSVGPMPEGGIEAIEKCLPTCLFHLDYSILQSNLKARFVHYDGMLPTLRARTDRRRWDAEILPGFDRAMSPRPLRRAATGG
jgi:hypothetical protein